MNSRSAISSDQKEQVIYLRELGLTSAAIAEQSGLSLRSIQRICKASRVVKGALSEEVLEGGRRRLRELTLSEESVKNAVVGHLLDEFAQVKLLREKASAVFEGFNPRNDKERAVFMRSAVAYSTLLKNTSDIMRRATDLDRQREDSMAEVLPEFVVKIMSPDDVAEIRAAQAEEARNLGCEAVDD